MDISIKLKGKEIGKVDHNNVQVEYEEDQIRSGLGSRLLTYTKSKTVYVKFEAVKFNNSISELDYSFLDRSYDFVAKSIKIPNGKKLPKRKRLRKKVEKKYTYTFIYHNCQVRL